MIIAMSEFFKDKLCSIYYWKGKYRLERSLAVQNILRRTKRLKTQFEEIEQTLEPHPNMAGM